ncbi:MULTISPECIES: HAD-IA family hydrolase [unclassified Streptomyces]|uniref:HAD-IA family hydrolase n=1 Tax=Streptomyces sp. NBC_00180 TaxID=2903632 RepID=A0AAU1IDL4_9ACTN|nr:HAD-IA family hydrolase [Streptomyces sp. NBC_01017]
MHHAAHRVLVVGIDGVRLDVLNRLPTPHLDALAAEGFLAPIEVDADTPTMSGPCWATVVTGVTVAKHGVWSNDFTGNRLDVFPDFATRLAVQDGRRTFVAAGWQPLMQAHHGGPLFRAPSRAAYVSPTADTPEAWEHCDEQITEASVRVLAGAGAGAEAGAAGGDDDDVVASFVYLGAPDETAHFLGCGEAYEASIRRADARLGRLIAAVRSRPSYADEQWTFLVATDHGHVDAGGHGGRTPEESTAWLAAAGPGIGPAPRPLRHADVAAQVFAALGRHPDRHWTLDGRPFAAAPHAVLLDMDGTLVDTESLWLRTVREAVPRIGADDLFDVLGRSATEAAVRLLPLTGDDDPKSLAADLEARFLTAVQREAAPLPGALALLDLLQASGIPTALVSASSRQVMDAVLKTLGADRFRTTVAEGETPRSKPAADPYLAAARSLGVDPAACLAVEDSPTGVAAAEAAGCRVLAVPSYAPIDPGPRRTVRRGLEGIRREELWAAGL